MLGAEVAKSARTTASLWWNTALGFGAFALFGFGAGITVRWAWRAASDPASMLWAGVVDSWYKPDYKDWRDKNHYKKMSKHEEGATTLRPEWTFGLFCGVPGVALLFGALGAFWAYRSCRLKNQSQIVAEAQVLLRQDLENQKTMWAGLRMSVEGVHYYLL